jgi:hypothetical protein
MTWRALSVRPYTAALFNVILIVITVYCALKAGLIGADEVGVNYAANSTSYGTLGIDTNAAVGFRALHAETTSTRL